MFKWICYWTGLAIGLAVLALLFSLKQNVVSKLEHAQQTVQNVNKTVSTVNGQLPDIVAEIKKGTATLSDLAEDVQLLKSVAGIQNDDSKRGLRGLATYSDEVHKMLSQETQGKESTIWIEEIVGSDLKLVESTEEFLIGLNRELLTVVLPLAKSKQEILYRITHSGPPRRKPFHIKIGDTTPVLLSEFIKSHHAESAALPEFKK